MRLTLTSLEVIKEDYSPSGQWASSNQLKALIEKRLTSPENREVLPADFLWILAVNLCWVSSLPAYMAGKVWSCQPP